MAMSTYDVKLAHLKQYFPLPNPCLLMMLVKSCNIGCIIK